jgi:hypothetical protein
MSNKEHLQQCLSAILDLERDEDGLVLPARPHARLHKQFGLDTSYMDKFGYKYEGSSMHEDTRLIDPSDPRIAPGLFKSLSLAEQLFDAALRIFGDSLIAYSEGEEVSIFRYFPPAIITFWSGFEAHVRFQSELLSATVDNIPEPVKALLLEYETIVNDKGEVIQRERTYSVMDRYRTLLKYGYRYQVDRGSQYWQNGEKARKLRNYLVHIDVTESQGIKSQDVLDFMENIMLLFIAPSCAIGKSVLRHQFRFHTTVTELRDLIFPHTEQPFFHEFQSNEKFLTHLNFDGIDARRFPHLGQLRRQRRKSR